MTDRRAELLKSDIDLGFTFVAVALTSYTAGNKDRARRAARDAQKKLRAAQKQLANIEVGREQQRIAADRLKRLEEVLTTIEARDPGVFSSRLASAEVQQDPSAIIPQGSQGHTHGRIVSSSGDDE